MSKTATHVTWRRVGIICLGIIGILVIKAWDGHSRQIEELETEIRASLSKFDKRLTSLENRPTIAPDQTPETLKQLAIELLTITEQIRRQHAILGEKLRIRSGAAKPDY